MSSRCTPRNCEVCCIAQSKYKCPNCLAPYCSLACFKKHKEVPCQKPSPLVEELPNRLPPQQPFEVEDPSWVVDRDHLQLIVSNAISLQAANSSAIQEILKNAELRRIIRQIDGADEPEDQLMNAMEGEVFRDLTEKILSIASPKE